MLIFHLNKLRCWRARLMWILAAGRLFTGLPGTGDYQPNNEPGVCFEHSSDALKKLRCNHSCSLQKHNSSSRRYYSIHDCGFYWTNFMTIISLSEIQATGSPPLVAHPKAYEWYLHSSPLVWTWHTFLFPVLVMYTLQKGRIRKTEIKFNRATPMEQKLWTATLSLQPEPPACPNLLPVGGLSTKASGWAGAGGARDKAWEGPMAGNHWKVSLETSNKWQRPRIMGQLAAQLNLGGHQSTQIRYMG